jgi:hypothetical protein
MSTFKALAVALALAMGAGAWARDGTGSAGDRMDLLSTWWAPDGQATRVFTWSRSDEGRELLHTWWQPARTPLTFAFSSLREDDGLALRWSQPEEGREFLFTWSRQGEQGEPMGSAAGEPSLP